MTTSTSTTGFKGAPSPTTNPCTVSWPESANTIRLVFETGRLRRLELGAVLVLAGTAGWLWLGGAGLALVVLWARTQWPLPRFLCYELDSRCIRVLRLGIVRVRWSEGWWTGREVFSDELNAAEFAALRRFLKAAVRSGEFS